MIGGRLPIETYLSAEKARVYEYSSAWEQGPFNPVRPRPRAEEWRRLCATVFARDNFTCTYCGIYDAGDGAPELHCDHVIPVAKGGTHEVENLTTACRSCNLSKGARTPYEWCVPVWFQYLDGAR